MAMCLHDIYGVNTRHVRPSSEAQELARQVEGERPNSRLLYSSKRKRGEVIYISYVHSIGGSFALVVYAVKANIASVLAIGRGKLCAYSFNRTGRWFLPIPSPEFTPLPVDEISVRLISEL